MEAEMLAVLARLAGLEKALAEFPEDVAAAAAPAGGHRDAIRIPDDPAAEPWPAMHAGPGRTGGRG